MIYDEAKGWPEDGIAPGTPWEDVPEDWLCPDCGVGKLDFEMIEMTDDSPEPIESETAVPAREPVIEAAPLVTSKSVQAPTMNMGTSVDDSDGKAPVVIIGTGLAGYNLAREFRKLDKTTPLLMISSDDGLSLIHI